MQLGLCGRTVEVLLDHEVQKIDSGEEAEIAAACAGAPGWITPEVVKDTLLTFRPLYKERLTAIDAVEILVNAGQLFEILYEDKKVQMTKG